MKEIQLRIISAFQNCSKFEDRTWFGKWATLTICDVGGNFCFEKMMDKYVLNSASHCLPNCHELRFTTDQYIEKIDADLVCKDIHSIESYIAKETSGYGKGANLIFTATKLQEFFSSSSGEFGAANKSIDLDGMRFEYCRKLVKEDLARLTILFENKKYVRSRTNKRVTFSERLGAFGKISFLYSRTFPDH